MDISKGIQKAVRWYSSLNSSNTFPVSAYNFPKSGWLVRLTIPGMGCPSPHGICLTIKGQLITPIIGYHFGKSKLLACDIPLSRGKTKLQVSQTERGLDSRPQSEAAPALFPVQEESPRIVMVALYKLSLLLVVCNEKKSGLIIFYFSSIIQYYT